MATLTIHKTTSRLLTTFQRTPTTSTTLNRKWRSAIKVNQAPRETIYPKLSSNFLICFSLHGNCLYCSRLKRLQGARLRGSRDIHTSHKVLLMNGGKQNCFSEHVKGSFSVNFEPSSSKDIWQRLRKKENNIQASKFGIHEIRILEYCTGN